MSLGSCLLMGGRKLLQMLLHHCLPLLQGQLRE
jgi:hypothetical protein